MPKKKSAASGVKKRKVSKRRSKLSAGEMHIEKGKKYLIDKYEFNSKKIPITINIVRVYGEFVPLYEITISSISKNTEVFLEKIRQELIKEVNLGIVEITDLKKMGVVESKFTETIVNMIQKYFPDVDENTSSFLTSYLVQKSLGLGKVEILIDDPNLEEIAINGGEFPVWVYHRKHGWLKTNVMLDSDEQVRHFATMIGRKVGRQITVLEPLMDAHLGTGDRVNATLFPISSHGNTITLRKFASKPWTITDFLRTNTISYSAAALIWTAIQFELSILIAGGTASGKTSMLNVMSNFFPPNQRIISIEDTREIQLPSFLHWVPMVTRLPNAEGKGEVAMIDLLANSLRQRPDRIVVGEIRRKREAEVLFEAIHTGHSVYATVHANSVHETITRLTNPPIEVPITMLPAVSLVVVQFRNRRSGSRRTFQVAEITEDGKANVLLQFDPKSDSLRSKNKSYSLMRTLEMYTGMTRLEINKKLEEKEKVLRWLVRHNINDVESVGRVMAEYYTYKDNLMSYVKKDRPFWVKEGQ